MLSFVVVSCIDTWWRHQTEAFSALLNFCAGNSPVTGEFPASRSVTRSFGVFFDLRLNRQFSKQLWGWWSETPSRPLWRHCYVDSFDLFIHMLQCWLTSTATIVREPPRKEIHVINMEDLGKIDWYPQTTRIPKLFVYLEEEIFVTYVFVCRS